MEILGSSSETPVNRGQDREELSEVPRVQYLRRHFFLSACPGPVPPEREGLLKFGGTSLPVPALPMRQTNLPFAFTEPSELPALVDSCALFFSPP